MDDSLADTFVAVRNALMIWSGRSNPPPTIQRAGTLDGGLDYDLAPGMVPIARRGRIPTGATLDSGKGIQLSAASLEDARRQVEILKQRGYEVETISLKRAASRAPITTLNIKFEGPKISRSVAKSAMAGACVMYGNDAVRMRFAPEILTAAISNSPDIATFAGWDYWNDWPAISEFQPHKSCADRSLSGYEHTLLIADVGDSWVAYIELFGRFRMSVRLGDPSGLPPRGLALNPRSFKTSRFDCEASYPTLYVRQDGDSFKKNFALISEGIKAGLEAILKKWYSESTSKRVEDLSGKLADALVGAVEDDARRKAIEEWAAEVATVEAGETWIEELDSTLLDDGTIVKS